MTARPILFSGPMVRALLEGRKTQTRRVVTRSTVEVLGNRWGKSSPWTGLRLGEAWVRENSPISGAPAPNLAVPFCHPDDEPTPTDECGIYRLTPIIEAGDLLYVREEYSFDHSWTGVPPRDVISLAPIWYWADGNPTRGDWTKPKPGMHMPRWASRLTLTVTDVRVQRLQDISEDDAKAEGMSGEFCDYELYGQSKPYRYEFCGLWDSLNAARGYGWEANPWVVAVSFTVEHRNIDARSAA